MSSSGPIQSSSDSVSSACAVALALAETATGGLLANAFTEQAAVVSDLGAKATRFNVLKRELETERRIYDSMLQKTKEAGMASALRQSTIHVIDPATSSSGREGCGH